MGGFKLGKMTLRGLFQAARDRPVPCAKEGAAAGLKGARVQRRGRLHPVRHLRQALPVRRHSGGQARAHVEHRPLPLRAVRQLRARMPQAVLGHGTHVHAAFHGQVRGLLRGARTRKDGVGRGGGRARRGRRLRAGRAGRGAVEAADASRADAARTRPLRHPGAFPPPRRASCMPLRVPRGASPAERMRKSCEAPGGFRKNCYNSECS